jgi:glutamine amidotransferase
MEIAIIDYGSGNLRSVAKAFEKAIKEETLDEYKVIMATSAKDIANSSHIVLPGVGAFGDCKQGLSSIPDLTEAIEDAAFNKGLPLLGICVGMQLMATTGHEYGTHQGLDWVKGAVVPIDSKDKTLKIPHMGWNNISTTNHPIFDGIENGSHAYFVHSYHFKCEDEKDIIATTDYGQTITAAIAKDNIVGTQFHPEKSQAIGIKLISNFLKWKP